MEKEEKGSSGIDKDLFAFASGPTDLKGSKTKSEKSKAKKLKEDGILDAVSCQVQNDAQVSVAELAAVLGEETGFANLKRRVGDLVDADIAAANNEASRVEILAAPLPRYEQAKLERQAAYDLASKEANKWIPIIRANRNAKQVIFPAKQPAASTTAALLEDKPIPRTKLEIEMSAVLKKNQMDTEEGLITAEKLEMATLTVEEVESRYKELAKKRALLFFREKKLRQQSKIKSKTFRRIVKKEKERQVLKNAEASGDRLTEEEIREYRLKTEMDRIKERMSLKTRKASKWAHELMQRRRLESGSREQVMQQVRDKDRLRQEIMGKADENQSDDSENDGESDFEQDKDAFEDDEDQEDEEDEDEDDEDQEKSKKRSFSLLTRQRKSSSFKDDHESESDLEVDESETKLETESHNVDDDDEIDKVFENLKSKKNNVKEVENIAGRRTFAPSNAINNRMADDEQEKEIELAVLAQAKTTAANKPPSKKKAKMTSNDVKNLFAAEDDDDNGDGQTVMDEKTREQLDLIKKAFSGDKVFEDFATKKTTEAEADAPKDIDLTLPGWGAWGGIGITPAKGKVILRRKGGIDPKKRKDAHLANVIIHEKRSKKTAMLMIGKVPYPFKSREEYERSLSNSTGKEWNSATNFVKKIQPRIQVRVGSIIEPIKFTKRQ